MFALLLSLTKTTPMSKLQKMKEDEKKPGRHYAICAANAIATSSYFGKVLICSKVANPHFAHLIQNSKASAKKLKGCLFFLDRKSTRLNSSHANISYAVFCLKKKKKKNNRSRSPPDSSTYTACTHSLPWSKNRAHGR